MPMELIRKAVSKGRRILGEFESKQVLTAYGIPVVKEVMASDREGLSQAMETIGFPLVIKGCAADLTHKSESGLVQTDVRGRQEAEEIFDRFMTQMTEAEKAVLVQEMVQGRRELAAGLIRDSQFGPCVMFGLGGIFAEIHRDTAFRVAPLETKDARAMMEEIRGHRILGPVRGMPEAERNQLAEILVQVGRIGMENPDVAEIDINPIILDDSGRPVAADALIVLHEP